MARKNLATGTVLTAPSPADSGTSLVLQSGEGANMPSTPFYATAHPDGVLPTVDNAEIILVTNVSTDTLTIDRAEKSTSAKSIATDWRISNAIYAEEIDERVVGPSSATDAVPPLFDGTTGKLLKNSTPTGTGNPVLATSPTLVTPALGTPASGVMTNVTGLPTTGLVDGAVTPAKRAGGFKVGTINPAGTGSLATTGVGFTPKLVLFYLHTVSSSTVNYTGIGAMDGTTQSAAATYNEQSVDNSGATASDRCILAVVANNSILVDAAFTSFDADGFTINVITRGGSRVWTYIAFG